jgi:hypothetical protein
MASHYKGEDSAAILREHERQAQEVRLPLLLFSVLFFPFPPSPSPPLPKAAQLRPGPPLAGLLTVRGVSWGACVCGRVAVAVDLD